MHVLDLVEVVTLGEGWSRCYAALRIARNGPQIFDVRGQEQAAVVDPKRVRGVGEHAQLHPRAHLMLIARERRVVVIEPHTGADLPVVRRRDRRLGVDPHVAAFQVGAGRGPGAARVRDRGEVLVPARIRGEYAGLEFEPVVRLQCVVQLHAGRMEVAVFAQDVVRRVWEEDERRGVAETGCIGEAAVAEECAQEQLGGLEPVAPAEVHEAVDILLMIVDHALGRVERHGEAGARAIQLEVHHVAVGGDILDLAEPEQIRAVVVKVLDAVVQRIEGHRFPPHVGCLPRSGEEEPPLVGVGTDVQRLPIRRE